VNFESHIFKRSSITGEWSSFGSQTLLTTLNEMLFELEPSSKLNEVQSKFVEFNSTSHPSLKFIQLVLFFLEKSDFKLSYLSGYIKIKIS